MVGTGTRNGADTDIGRIHIHGHNNNENHQTHDTTLAQSEQRSDGSQLPRSHRHHHHHHHHRHYHRSRHTVENNLPPQLYEESMNFLRSIPLTLDPASPPPPFFPPVSFASAIAALASVSPEEWAHWEAMKQSASVDFLKNIPMGTERADQRPQPLIQLRMDVAPSRQELQSQQNQLIAVGGAAVPLDDAIQNGNGLLDSMPPSAPTLSAHPSLQYTHVGGAIDPASLAALSLLPNSRAVSAIEGEMLLYPTAAPLLLHSSTPPPVGFDSSLAPLRIQTPPSLLLVPNHPTVANQLYNNPSGSPAVGAHIYSNPLLFPSTLSAPLDLTRSTTQLNQFHAHALAALQMNRATSEYPMQPRAFPPGFVAPGMIHHHHHHNSLTLPASITSVPPSGGGLVSTPLGSSSNPQRSPFSTAPPVDAIIKSTVDSLDHHNEQGVDGSPLAAANATSSDDVTDLHPMDNRGSGRALFRTTNGPAGANSNCDLLSSPQNNGPGSTSAQQMAPPSSNKNLHHAQTGVRDGFGQGLKDFDALFVSSPYAAAAGLTSNSAASANVVPHMDIDDVVSQEESWEKDLLSRGIHDARTRLVFTSGVAGSRFGKGVPLMLSSLSPFMKDHGSSASSTSHTPHTALNRSRTNSFSLDMAAAMASNAAGAGSGSDQGATSAAAAAALLSIQHSAGGAGKNTLLNIAAAAAAAHQAEEERDDRSEQSLFGRRKGTSYAYLLPSVVRRLQQQASDNPTNSDALTSLITSTSGAGVSMGLLLDSNDAYDPCFLDDPNIKSGKHRVVLNLPGFMSSLISYVRTKELKKELNETFLVRHEEWLANPKMTLSKLRKCKALLLAIGVELNLELSTIAVAYIYFEKLVCTNFVDKPNRKLMAGVSLLLAFKWVEGNEVSSLGSSRKTAYSKLFAACEKILHVSKSAILKSEFPVYLHLGFNLNVKTEHVLHHFRQCLSKLDTVPQDYLTIEWSL